MIDNRLTRTHTQNQSAHDVQVLLPWEQCLWQPYGALDGIQVQYCLHVPLLGPVAKRDTIDCKLRLIVSQKIYAFQPIRCVHLEHVI